MKILNKVSKALRSLGSPTNIPKNQFLTTYEIRLIAEGELDKLADFAVSERLHFADPKGDTPLHLAARMGNLALCDLFIRSKADPNKLNFERKTPADIALLEGHALAAQLLSSLVTEPPIEKKPQKGYSTLGPKTTKAQTTNVSENRFTVSPESTQEAFLDSGDKEIEEKYWTTEREQKLTRLWSLGVSPSQIARELGGLATSGAILNQVHCLGILQLRGTASERNDPTKYEEFPKSTTSLSWSDERIDLLKRMWVDGQSAGQIAKELGGVSRNAVLSKAHRLRLPKKEDGDNGSLKTTTEVKSPLAALPIKMQSKLVGADGEQSNAAISKLNYVDDLLVFEAEEEPEHFFRVSAREAVSGTFIPLVNPLPAFPMDKTGDWDLDLSPQSIAVEGIGAVAIAPDHGTEHDFLKVRNRGRQSIKPTVLQSGTRLSIDSEICSTWANEILKKGWYSISDIESLLFLCEGNGDLDELVINLQRSLEVSGFTEVDLPSEHGLGVWTVRSQISSDELAETIETSLTRSKRLPGTQLFVMDKPDEQGLLATMVRAKQELHLGILASEHAVQTICDVVNMIQTGVRNPNTVSLKTIIPSRPGHTQTAEVIAAVGSLKSWQENGCAMDGKQRRQALAALEALDLSRAFLKELVRSIEQNFPSADHANKLNTQLSLFEAANERLILKHLPYARRFAARSVQEGEDPEDVFQMAFIGLQRSTRRFNPERGYRFVIYASYWMRQAITRWRADEGCTIRIPIHQKEKIARLDRALEKLDVKTDGSISEKDLAAELQWTIEEVSHFRRFPREAVYPERIADWDELYPQQEDANAFDMAETKIIITDLLAELPEKEADIIRMRFGIDRDTDMTLEEIGQIYGVTRERIRQLEAKGLRRLSHPVRKRQLRAFLGFDSSRGSKIISEQERKLDDASETNNNRRETMSWTEGRVARLEKLWASGMSASKIAKELGGTSRNAVIGKLNRLNLVGPR